MDRLRTKLLPGFGEHCQSDRCPGMHHCYIRFSNHDFILCHTGIDFIDIECISMNSRHGIYGSHWMAQHRPNHFCGQDDCDAIIPYSLVKKAFLSGERIVKF